MGIDISMVRQVLDFLLGEQIIEIPPERLAAMAAGVSKKLI